MTHTPGPWKEFFYVRNQRLKIGDWAFVHGDGHHPLPLRHTKQGQREAAANARLIAAAPELLAALHISADALDYAQAQVDSENDAHNLRVRLVQVKRVIAKAEGRTDEE
jgi:hypothetical protein